MKPRYLAVVASLLLAVTAVSTPPAAAEPSRRGADLVSLSGSPVEMVYSADGASIFVVTDPGKEREYRLDVIRVSTGKTVSSRRLPEFLPGSISLAMSPRRDLLLLGYFRSAGNPVASARVLDPNTGADRPVEVPMQYTDGILFNLDGSRFYTFTKGWGDSPAVLAAYNTSSLAPLGTAEVEPPEVVAAPLADRYLMTVTRYSPELKKYLDIPSIYDATTLQPLAQGRTEVKDCLSFSPSGDRVYGQTTDARGIATLSAFDPATLAVIASTPLGISVACSPRTYDYPGTMPLALSPDGSRAYVTTNGLLHEDPWIAVIDTRTMTLIGRLPAAGPTSIFGMSPDGQTLWLSPGKNTLRAVSTSAIEAVPPTWLGNGDALAALPGVQSVEGHINNLLSGPFVARHREKEDEGWEVQVEVIRTPEATRITRTPYGGPWIGSVTYDTPSLVCTRKLSLESPATLSADRRAKFRCRSRAPQTYMPTRDADFAALLPTRAHQTRIDTLDFIAVDQNAGNPNPRTLSVVTHRFEYDDVDMPEPPLWLDYTIAPGKATITGLLDDGDWRGEVQILTQGIPRLPKVTSLKR